jgi:trehalose-6-phosphate synthase
MDPAERSSRATRLRDMVRARTSADWMQDQLAAAHPTD